MDRHDEWGKRLSQLVWMSNQGIVTLAREYGIRHATPVFRDVLHEEILRYEFPDLYIQKTQSEIAKESEG